MRVPVRQSTDATPTVPSVPEMEPAAHWALVTTPAMLK